MSDPQLLRLREEYRRTSGRKVEVESAIKDLENKLGLVQKLRDSLQEGGLSEKELLDALNIRAKSSSALMYKVLGLKKQTERALTELKAEAHKLTATLSSLTVCPRCSGLGRLSSTTRYERMQEGPIIPVQSVQECHLCNGAGKLRLDDQDLHRL